MAQVIKDSSARGQRYAADVVKKPETMIIPARELVQVFAKVSFSFLFYGLWFANFALVPSIIIICLISVGTFVSTLVELTRCHKLVF